MKILNHRIKPISSIKRLGLFSITICAYNFPTQLNALDSDDIMRDVADNSQVKDADYYHHLCTKAGGYFQYGIIDSPPNSDYATTLTYGPASKSILGIPLSHTYIEITSALDGNIYQVAIDNLFANNYDPLSKVVPATYADNLTAGSIVYLCSGNPTRVPYSFKGNFAVKGIDWVHPNCSNSGSHSVYQTGFLYASNRQNLTNNQTYCYLWYN
jgi:hypothetical protein